MAYVFLIFTFIWICVNCFFIVLSFYIKWLSSKKRLTLYDKKVQKIRRKFAEGK